MISCWESISLIDALGYIRYQIYLRYSRLTSHPTNFDIEELGFAMEYSLESCLYYVTWRTSGRDGA